MLGRVKSGNRIKGMISFDPVTSLTATLTEKENHNIPLQPSQTSQPKKNSKYSIQYL